MEPGTLEQKIAKLPEDLKLKAEIYIDALNSSTNQANIVSEPAAIYQTSNPDNWKKLMDRLDKLPPDLKSDIGKNIEKLLPLEVDKAQHKPSTPRAKFGELKGFVTYMSDDFDAPLEEFKDYM